MKDQVTRIWYYFLAIDKDLEYATRFVEPEGQEEVYSLEFTKIILLACTELENVFKLYSKSKGTGEPGNISEYKSIVLEGAPGIINAVVYARDKMLVPFSEWPNEKLSWWEAYTDIKHSRAENFRKGNYINAANAVGALYVMILYLDKLIGADIHSDKSSYIQSDYSKAKLLIESLKPLP